MTGLSRSTCVLLLLCASARAADPTGTAASPSTAPAPRSPQEIVKEIQSDQTTVNGILGEHNATLKTEASLKAAAPKLVPLLQQVKRDLDELITADPRLAGKLTASQMQLRAMLSALGNDQANDEINAMLFDKNSATSAVGQGHLLLKSFYVIDPSPRSQEAFVKRVARLDQANSQSVLLAEMTLQMAKETGDPAAKDLLINIVADDMHNDLATATKAGLAERKRAAAEDAALPHQPFTLTGSLADGTEFSTDSLKGKVVLIDFWATWCVPCVAELPRVKKMYAEYHDSGLEIVGISNDYDVTALNGFVAHQNMPWAQLFDPTAASNHEWNSITKQRQIESIPVMYLIDREGVLRSVNARGNMEELIPQLLAEK